VTSKILIVDDMETMRLYEKMILSGCGYELDTAENGLVALDKIKKDKPDLVLLDVMMPQMDGIECLKRIRKDEQSKDIKVIVLTTNTEYERVKEAFMAGCDDFITKPVNRVELLSKVEELLRFIKLKELLKR
jgi:two-component system alkaline phosphatase synthesis response regulator PhoP